MFIKDLELPDECVFTSVFRDERVIYPRGNTRIQEFDNILVLTNDSGLLELKKQISRGVKNAWFKK